MWCIGVFFNLFFVMMWIFVVSIIDNCSACSVDNVITVGSKVGGIIG